MQQIISIILQLHDNAVINLSQQMHCSAFGNNLVCHAFASTAMTDKCSTHIYSKYYFDSLCISSNWYFIHSSMQYNRYYLLHTRAKIVYNFVLDCTIICCI